MGRIRTIKPEFFLHHELYLLEVQVGLPVRLAFAGLWTQCDREGRFSWKPAMLKTQILPYDNADFGAILNALVEKGFIEKYSVDGKEYGAVPSWTDHQIVNNREAQSKIPTRAGVVVTRGVVDMTRNGNCSYAPLGEGKGKEGKEDIDPEMVTRGVLSELRISGRDLAVALDEVCRSEMKTGRDPADLRDSLIASWRDYDLAKPRLGYIKGAVKFFGEGDWRNKAGWPWKPGMEPKESGKRVYANA